MHAECPLCGREMKQIGWESVFSPYSLEAKYQIRNLKMVIVGLKAGDECVCALASDRYEMCPLCQQILSGFTSDAEQKPLIARLQRAVKTLEKYTYLLGGYFFLYTFSCELI